jgi:hypothetical protein
MFPILDRNECSIRSGEQFIDPSQTVAYREGEYHTVITEHVVGGSMLRLGLKASNKLTPLTSNNTYPVDI